MYGSIAALPWNPKPSCLWIAHRVTEIYKKDGRLCFRTKGDNNPEVDPWEVPEYWVTGKVVSISHTDQAPQKTPETQPVTRVPTSAYSVQDTEAWFAVLGSTGLVAICIFITLDHRKRQSSDIISLQKCRCCQYYQAQYAYSLIQVNGRLEMRRTVELSKGFCERLGVTVFEGFPKRKCRKSLHE